MEDISRSIPKISAPLENQEEHHQTSMVKIQGMIKDKTICILIDPGASLSYISPRIVELYKLHQEKFEKYWLVELATSTKRKVTSFVKNCEFIMNDIKTC